MSRRTKLTITAVFLVLLAIPVVYIVHIWHSPNPLSCRIVGERIEDDPFDVADTRWIRMELRNTSDVTVTLLSGTFHGHAAAGEEPTTATALISGSGWAYEPIAIPPGGIIEVEFEAQIPLPKEAIASGRAGRQPARKGSVEYGWLSAPQVRFEEAYVWLAHAIPARWSRYLPIFEPNIDTAEVESADQQNPATHADPKSVPQS